MRYKRFRLITTISLLLFSGFALLVAFFAYQLHLDNNLIMGTSRKVLALLGFCCLGLAFALVFSDQIRTSWVVRSLSAFFRKTSNYLANSSFGKGCSAAFIKFRATGLFRWFDRNPWVWGVFSVLIIILIYFWFITGGKWTWTPYSHYFDMLANAYLKGSVALLEKPPAELSSLANPYDYTLREGFNYLWDASYFNGKYFLYWGPVPALLAALVKLAHPGVVEDQQLVFVFLSGLAIVMAALLHWLRSRYYPRSPAWTSGLFTLAVMLCLPVMWVINRATVYEAAIAGGQFFLLLGLYAALRSMRSGRKSAWLLLAGISWGAAVNCRINNALAVIWFVILISLFFIIFLKKPSTWLLPLVVLFIPLVLSASGLGWYNFTRFGSIFETGHRFQLTGPALPANYNDVVSWQYIIPNLYNFLFRPVSLNLRSFPFINIPYVTDYMWPFFIHRPDIFYSSEPVTGIFASIPFFWLLLLGVFKPIDAIWRWAKELPAAARNPEIATVWIWGMVTGGVLLLLASLSVFITSMLRYLVDIVPLMTVLTSLCAWWGLQFLEKSRFWRIVLLVLIVVLAAAGIAAGLFIGFTVYPNRFENINPSLYLSIAAFFNGK